ncbi:MAG TPA: hypothetical protein VF980_14395 [Thermoanaerobaculia bacterium]
MRGMRSAALVVFCGLAAGSLSAADSAFLLAGEPVRLDENLVPKFSANQIENSADATRVGMARWAATDQAKKLIAFLIADRCEITIVEDAGEEGIGRAPQPGLATLIAANDRSRRKSFDLILNPLFFKVPRGMTPLPNQPATPADMMAAAWAGEMLHIYFYARGISLPHHPRADFQAEWREIALELGMPTLTHDDFDRDDYAFRRTAWAHWIR